MALIVVRVWVPDRPGALGAVASRIGAVHADVIGIDILERGAGRAVDELTVEISDHQHVDLLVQEISQVDGVDVEHVRPARASHNDRSVRSIAVASALLDATSADELLAQLVDGLHDLFEADWTAIVDPAAARTVAVSGGMEMPSAEWLSAFVIGSGVSDGSFAAVDELTRAALGARGLEVIVSRESLPLRAGERQILADLAALAAKHLRAFD